MKMEQSVPKRRHIKFRRRGITQKKAYNKYFKLLIIILLTSIVLINSATNANYDLTMNYLYHIQGDQKGTVHLMITIQKVTRNVQSVPRQSPDIYGHAELCFRRPCSV